MSLLLKLPEMIRECKEQYRNLSGEITTEYECLERVGDGENYLVRGNNLNYMRYLLEAKNMKESLQFIYIDPPFFSKADYKNSIEVFNDSQDKVVRLKQKSYEDTWENGMEEYLKMLTVRFLFMKELLAASGCLWVHLDWHAVHYVKVILDEIFGEDHFVNEIIWHYKSGGVSKKRFARKHDSLLFYSKTKNYYFAPQKEKSYNRGFKPYRFKGVAEYEDETGWYTLVNMKDVWSIDMVGRTSAERTGYATQKPEALLERILRSCTKEGDLCADFFSGSGTLAVVAHRLDRRWISCDQGALAISNSLERLMKKKAGFGVWMETNDAEEGFCDRGALTYEIGGGEDTEATKWRLRLISYEPTDDLRKEAASLFGKAVEQQLNVDPLALVSYWGIDLNYDGDIFQADQNFFREKGKLTVSWEPPLQKRGTIAVRIMDIFGNCQVYIID